MFNNILKRIILIFATAFFTLCSCTGRIIEYTPTAYAPSAHFKTPTDVVVTTIVVPTTLPISEPTNTSTATLETVPTRKPSPTLTFTPYPIFSLSPEEAARIGDFLTMDQACRLPCWNGVTPGISSVGDLQGFFARLGIDIQELSPEKFSNGALSITTKFDYYPYRYKNYAPWIIVYWEDGIVKEITFDLLDYSLFDMTRYAETLGIPDQIDYEVRNGGGYFIRLHYQKYQMVIMISGKTVMGESICLTGEDSPWVGINLYASEPDWEEIALSRTGYWVQWESKLNLTTEGVFNKLQEPGICMPVD